MPQTEEPPAPSRTPRDFAARWAAVYQHHYLLVDRFGVIHGDQRDEPWHPWTHIVDGDTDIDRLARRAELHANLRRTDVLRFLILMPPRRLGPGEAPTESVCQVCLSATGLPCQKPPGFYKNDATYWGRRRLCTGCYRLLEPWWRRKECFRDCERYPRSCEHDFIVTEAFLEKAMPSPAAVYNALCLVNTLRKSHNANQRNRHHGARCSSQQLGTPRRKRTLRLLPLLRWQALGDATLIGLGALKP